MSAMLLELCCSYSSEANAFGQRLLGVRILESTVLFPPRPLRVLKALWWFLLFVQGWWAGAVKTEEQEPVWPNWRLENSLLGRLSVDKIAGASCEGSLISIRPDSDVIGFGPRLSTPSLAHLVVSSIPGLYPQASVHT